MNAFKDADLECFSIYDYHIEPCHYCDYQCFYQDDCKIDDDIKLLYEKCFNADLIIFSLPT